MTTISNKSVDERTKEVLVLSPEEISKLPDYSYELDRNKIRFNGMGPRLHGQDHDHGRDKIWTRDYIDHQAEIKKILYQDLISKCNRDTSKFDEARKVLRVLFEGLRNCNINSLFEKYCRLNHHYFDQVTFAINYALDAYTEHESVIRFIHHVLMSVNAEAKKYQTFKGSNNFLVKTLFGSNKNYDLFKRHTRWLVIGNAKYRRFMAGHLVSYNLGDSDNNSMTMDINHIRWLDEIDVLEVKYRVLIQVMNSLARFILELLRRYFHITVGNPFSEKLFYYRYDLWQKMHSLTIRDLIYQDILYPMVANNVSIAPETTSRLKFHLKRDGLRLICTRYKSVRDSDLSRVKAILRRVLVTMTNYKKFSLNNLLLGLKQFRKKMLYDSEKIYFVRADIKDCFPSVDQEKARDIISKSLREIFPNNAITLYKGVFASNAKKTISGRSKSGKIIIKYTTNPELLAARHPGAKITRERCFTYDEFDQKYLRPHLVNCILRESCHSLHVYNLTKGLRQGSSFSPIFCSIYIQQAFNEHLSQFYNCEDCTIYCYVDDILFLSTNLEKARQFMHKMLKGFPDFNLRMNLDKLHCNFECPGLDDRYCRQNLRFVFYKEQILLGTLQCRYDYNFSGVEFQDTFTVTPYYNEDSVERFIENTKIGSIHIDFELNGFDGVILNIHEKALLLAFKISVIFLLSFKLRNYQKNQDDGKCIMKAANLVARKIYSAIKSLRKRKANCCKDGCDCRVIVNLLIFREVEILVLAAFKRVWSLNKLRHRVAEYRALERQFSRTLAFLMTNVSPSQRAGYMTGEEWDVAIKQLSNQFHESPFNNLKLPVNTKILQPLEFRSYDRKLFSSSRKRRKVC